ncbi:MAG TPA: hypothetical protein VFJ24_06220 [Gaiellales bacterium]|nr:hypothetical protein [Gaiellales bacterium]
MRTQLGLGALAGDVGPDAFGGRVGSAGSVESDLSAVARVPGTTSFWTVGVNIVLPPNDPVGPVVWPVIYTRC